MALNQAPWTGNEAATEDDDDEVVTIHDVAECRAYDALVAVLQHHWHPQGPLLSWVALRRDDDKEVAIHVNGPGDLYYALHPWEEAGANVWELMAFTNGHERQVLWAEGCLVLAIDAAAYIAAIAGTGPQRRWSDQRASPTRH